MVYKVLDSSGGADTAGAVAILEYQVETYYPRLRSILVPTKGVWEQLVNDRISFPFRYSPPLRWEEPIIQRHIKNYLAVLSAHPHPGNNDNIHSDPVFANIINPDVRKKILERRMDEKTYNSIYRQISSLQTVGLLGDPATTKVTIRPSPGKLVPYEEQAHRFDDLPIGLLAVESGLQTATVKRMLDRGLKGSQIVDAGFIMKDRKTTSPVVEGMIRQGIEDWPDIIDTARQMQCGVKFVLTILATLGPDNVEELTSLVDIAISDVSEFAVRRRVRLQRAWYIFLKIYNGEARRDAERALDLFTGSF
jgi:hypothetical protein